jgi:hypothetical protein
MDSLGSHNGSNIHISSTMIVFCMGQVGCSSIHASDPGTAAGSLMSEARKTTGRRVIRNDLYIYLFDKFPCFRNGYANKDLHGEFIAPERFDQRLLEVDELSVRVQPYLTYFYQILDRL